MGEFDCSEDNKNGGVALAAEGHKAATTKRQVRDTTHTNKLKVDKYFLISNGKLNKLLSDTKATLQSPPMTHERGHK